jgi:hypothetical protein
MSKQLLLYNLKSLRDLITCKIYYLYNPNFIRSVVIINGRGGKAKGTP